MGAMPVRVHQTGCSVSENSILQVWMSRVYAGVIHVYNDIAAGKAQVIQVRTENISCDTNANTAQIVSAYSRVRNLQKLNSGKPRHFGPILWRDEFDDMSKIIPFIG